MNGHPVAGTAAGTCAEPHDLPPQLRKLRITWASQVSATDTGTARGRSSTRWPGTHLHRPAWERCAPGTGLQSAAQQSRRPGATARLRHAQCQYLGPALGDLRGRSFVLTFVEDRCDFFDSTSKAVVSASARSVRNRSRSSSLMRFLSCLVARGLARTSSGSASATVALASGATTILTRGVARPAYLVAPEPDRANPPVPQALPRVVQNGPRRGSPGQAGLCVAQAAGFRRARPADHHAGANLHGSIR